jgi:hypothetical protein
MMVQEKVNHEFTFTISSILPGTVNAENPDETIMPAMHIFFPPSFEQDTDNAATDAVTISGTGISITSAPTYTVDASALYDSDC